MKKILSLMLGMTFVFGTLAFAQDASKDSSTDTAKAGKKKGKKKKSADKMDSSAPKQ